MDRPGVLRLAVDLQPVRGLDLLGDDRRRVRHRAGQKAVRLHRGGRHARAITGSAVTAVLARDVPIPFLLLAAAALLEVAVISMRGLSRISDALSREPGRRRRPSAAARSPASAGARLALPARHLPVPAAVLDYLDLPVLRAGRHRETQLPDRGSQTAFFASVDLAVNVLTLGIQLFLTGRIVKRLGVGLTLAILPLVSALGFGLLAVAPTIASVVVFGVLRGRQLRHRPAGARGAVHRAAAEDRYKAKAFIDTVVYRLGDQVGAWSYNPRGLARPERHRALGPGGAAVARLARQRPLARAPARLYG